MAQAQPVGGEKPDAIAMLIEDHRTVEALFQQFEEGILGEDAEARSAIVDQIVLQLTVHADIEEQVVYPAMREAFPDGEDMVEEAEHEHAEAKSTIIAIQALDPGTGEHTQMVRELIASVRHHVTEEEGVLFPRFRQHVDPDRLFQMADEMEGIKSRSGIEKPDVEFRPSAGRAISPERPGIAPTGTAGPVGNTPSGD